jgi:hypothetical protein
LRSSSASQEIPHISWIPKVQYNVNKNTPLVPSQNPENIQAKGFRKRPSAKRAGELFSFNRNQLRILTGLFTGHCHLKGHLFKLGLVDSPECDRCKQASETASHVLGNCEVLAALRFRYLGYHFMKPGDF